MIDTHDPLSLRMLATLSSTEASRRFGVSERTWHRWQASGNLPAHVLRCLRYEAGFLPGWEGYRILPSGVIITPKGDEVHKNQVDLFWWLVQLVCQQSADKRSRVYAALKSAA